MGGKVYCLCPWDVDKNKVGLKKVGGREGEKSRKNI